MSRDAELDPLRPQQASHPSPSAGPPRAKAVAMVASWGVAVAFGFGVLVHYSATPGASADAPPDWPSGVEPRPARDRPTLVMVVHPQCSCSRASVAELSRLITRLRGQLAAHVLFVQPRGFDREFLESDLWTSASIIDGVTIHVDEDGQQAELFGARTSGQTYLYEPSGRLLFSGGITPSRSHQGDSVGRQRIISLVTSGRADGDGSAVYGCGVEEGGEKTLFSLPSLL